ncbi:TPA: hypothetical protein ACIT51_005586, partial [Salmonella enterica subsp. enterica serovar Java]
MRNIAGNTPNIPISIISPEKDMGKERYFVKNKDIVSNIPYENDIKKELIKTNFILSDFIILP